MEKKLKTKSSANYPNGTGDFYSDSKPTETSERVVVDEIFDNHTVRLLRAKRLKNSASNELGIDTWEDEKEDFIEDWLVEAFVGFPRHRHLKEGDVFFIKDGQKLNKKYKPILREKARLIHLLRPWDYSRKLARNEIKAEFSKLSAVRIASENTKQKNRLFKKVEKQLKAKDK